VVEKAVQSALESRFGAGKWISAVLEGGNMLYLNLDLIREKKLDRTEVDGVAAEAARTVGHIFRVYTREQIMNDAVGGDVVGQAVKNGFYPARGRLSDTTRTSPLSLWDRA
jgi:hypothetical protein